MSNFIDMTGWVMKEHGVPDSKLTVLEKTEKRVNGHIIWKCQCECGKQCEINGTLLRRGGTRSCGCLNIEKTKKFIINLTNQSFGYLTAVEKTEKRATDGSVIWKCKCKCGNECEVSSSNLRNGNTKSCGCLQKELSAEKSINNLIGQNFGYLTVIKDSSKRNSKGCIYWKCKCNKCGGITYVVGQNLRNGHVKSCGCLKESYGISIIKNILNENNISFIKEKTFNDCRFLDTNYLVYFDFYVNNEYIIEFDGEQHFEPVEHFGGEKEFKIRQKHDKFKNQYCKEHNVPIIRIPYTHLEDICLEDLIPKTSRFLINKEENL